jgi:hypothetical protein
VQGILRLLLAFLAKIHACFEIKEAGLGARHAAVKELLTDEHKRYCLTLAESNVDRKCDRIIFSDESTLSSANYGPVLVYRPRGERYNCQYMSTCKRSGRVSFRCWGWISCERAGMLHRIGHLDDLQYKHIFQNVMVSSVSMFYPDGFIHFQQDHSSILVVASSQRYVRSLSP